MIKAALAKVGATADLESDYKTCHNKVVLQLKDETCKATYPECGGKLYRLYDIY